MARIDTGNFGNAVARVGRTPVAQDIGGGVNQAAQRLAGTMLGAVDDAIGRQERENIRIDRENKIVAERAEQAKTLTAHANIQNQLADAYDLVSSDVTAGKLDKISGTAAWKDAREKVLKDNLPAVPASRQELVAAQVQGLEGSLTNKLFDTFRKRDQQDVAGGLITYREQQERFASTDPQAAIKQYHTFVDQMGAAAGWTPEQSAKAKQTFVEGVTFNQFRTAAQSQLQTNSVDGLDEVQKKLAGPAGDALDPARRNALDQTIYGWKQGILAKQERASDKAEREQERRYNKARDVINKGKDIALSGGFIDPGYISQMVEMSQGTGLEPDVHELLASQRQVAGFASLPPAQRAAGLEQLRAQRADPARGVTPEGQKLLNRAEQIDASLRQKVQEGDAWSAAQSVGVVRNVAALNMGDPAGAVGALQTRMAEIGDVEVWAGQKVSPLQPAEADQFAKVLRTLKPDQAATLLDQVGTVLGDADRVGALAKQIGDKDGTLGLVMAFAGARTTEGRNTGQLILEGEQRIKDKAVRVDGAVETGWRGAIAKTVRGAYSNQEVENKILDAAFKIAAATDGDVDRAIRLASGGIVERNGGKVPLPYGMPENEFEKRLGGITADTLADQVPGGVVVVGPTRMPVADFVKTIPDARLVHAGQGVYNVRAGNQLVTNERGQRITLKVSP